MLDGKNRKLNLPWLFWDMIFFKAEKGKHFNRLLKSQQADVQVKPKPGDCLF